MKNNKETDNNYIVDIPGLAIEAAPAAAPYGSATGSAPASSPERCGLVMEGGAMRGMFTVGVIDTFMQNGIDFDGAVGTSAGAAFGCNIKSRQVGRPIRYNKRFCNDSRYSGIKSLLTTGDLYNARFCYHDVPFIYDIWDQETFAANPMEFYIVSTDVETGKPVYYKCDKGGSKDIQWIRASGAMPLLSKIVEINGRKLLDGGIGDSIAVRFMQKIGYTKNVVILTQPKGFVKKKNGALPMFKLMYRRYPDFVNAAADRHLRYNETLSYIEKQEALGRLFVIRPPEPLGIKHRETDPDELQRVYDIGVTTALGCIDSIKARGFCKR